MDLWQYIIPGIFTVIVAVLEFRADKQRKASDEDRARAERSAERRAEESRLSMNFMDANCKLSVVTAKALTGGHLNGNVEEAMEAAKTAQKEYKDFTDKLASGQLAKV